MGLGRGRDDLAVAEVAEHHVRRRVDRAQRAVDGERAGGGRAHEALREHDLERVAALDVLLRGANHRLVLGGCALGVALARAAQRRHRPDAGGQRAQQVGAELVRIPVVAGLGDDLEGPAHVVERDHDRRDQEAPERRGRRRRARSGSGTVGSNVEAAS